MATGPVKSQPLHNFSLSLLKWGNKNQMNNHRFRKRDPPPPSESDGDSEHEKVFAGEGSRPGKNRVGAAAAASPVERSNRMGEKENVAVEGDEKPWNLRPRRAPSKAGGVNKSGGESRDSVRSVEALLPPVAAMQCENLPKSTRLRGFVDALGFEKEKKTKFWISLSRDEIEEDIFVMTGSKPARRPRKRHKNVQKNVDNVFPGLWLAGITADDYRVPDAPAKK